MKEIIYTPHAPEPIGPYSQAVMSNGILYVSGQIPIDSRDGSIVSSSVKDETVQVMKNIEAILIEADMSFDDVVKCSIFVSEMSNFGIVNEVYGSYFLSSAPARETIEVSCLPKNVNVEISCIAIK